MIDPRSPGDVQREEWERHLAELLASPDPVDQAVAAVMPEIKRLVAGAARTGRGYTVEALIRRAFQLRDGLDAPA